MEQKHTREEKMEAFGRMLDVLDALREKCPWDRKQTNESLRPNTIEETYELCDALMKDDVEDICKELGDVLLHIAFYARIGEEKSQFDITDVCNHLVDKLIFRHPHVYHPSQIGAAHPRPLPYGENEEEREFSKVKNVEQVLDNWEQIKQKEKGGNKTVLAGVPASLPSLIKAYRIQDKSRHVKLNPDNALEKTNQKFTRRFNYIEQHSIKAGRPLTEMTLEEMDALWNEAKQNEKDKH